MRPRRLGDLGLMDADGAVALSVLEWPIFLRLVQGLHRI